MTRRLSLILGILLAVGAFVGILLVGAVVNPSPYHVVVAITEIRPGTVLEESMFGIDPQVVSPRVAQEYVLEDELPGVLGKRAARLLLPGQPLMHYDVVAADNPAAQRHLALALEDPDLAALVIPVDDNAPDGILPGDVVAVVWSVGEAGMEFAPVEAYPPAPGTPGGETPPTGEGEETSAGEGEEAPAELPAGLPPEVAALFGMTTSPIPEGVEPPLAKTIVNAARVIGVRREREANPAYTGQEGESPYVEGRIVGLEVVVPRDELEAVQFAIANGEYSIAVLSPNADVGDLADGSTLGVTWQDVKDYFLADRLRAMGVLTTTGPVRPAGASTLYGSALRSSPFGPRPNAGSSAAPPAAGTIVSPPGTGEAEGEGPTGVGEEGSTGGEESGVGEEEAAVAPSPVTPAPLPTATPASGRPGESEAAPSSGEETTSPESAGLPVPTGNLLAGLGCAAGVLVLVVAAVFLVVRALRRRRPA